MAWALLPVRRMIRCSASWLIVLFAACSGDGVEGHPDAAAGTLDAGADAGSADGGALVCGDLEPLPPSPDDDVTYDQWEDRGCFDGACLCADSTRPFVEDLLACRAVEGGYYWGLGSVAVRVSGRRGGDCIVRIGTDLEASVNVVECALPLPIQPWAGLAWVESDGGFSRFLDGIEERCVQEGQCSLVDGGPNPCWEDTELAAPVCLHGNGISCPDEST